MSYFSDLWDFRDYIEYKESNATPSVLEKAFVVEVGTKKTILQSLEVGTKPIRYRGYLASYDVTTQLIDNTLHTSVFYGIELLKPYDNIVVVYTKVEVTQCM